MQLYDWDEKYSAGYEPINKQHRVLLGQINKLLYNQKQNKNAILLLLDEIKMFAKFHFSSEENFMLIYEYEDYENHKKGHENLLSEMKEKTEMYKENKTDLEDIVKTVVKWFVKHTAKIDKDLGSFLTEKTGENSRFL